MEGWIKLHRKIEEWEWANNPNTFCLFVHLLLMANDEKTEWRGVQLQRGQLITSVHILSEKTGLTTKAIRTALERLTKSKNVAIKGANKFSIVTICKYDSYQENGKGKGRAKGQVKGEQEGDETASKGATDKEERRDNKLSQEERNIPPTPQGVEIIKNFGFEISTDKWGFADAVAMWLRHKKGKGQSYKTQDSFDTMVKNLIEMSDGDMQTAQKVVEQAIANNYAGLFPLRPSGSNSGSNTKPRKVSPLSVAKKMLGYNEPQNQKTEDVTWTEV